MKIYRCETCGSIITKAVDGQGPLSCCGNAMEELKAGVTDAAQEKHVPALKLEGNALTVTVGETIHPMTEGHYIQMILLRQGNLVQYVSLESTQEPVAKFFIDPDAPAEVYEYCNLHGLWMAAYAGSAYTNETICSAEFPQGCIDPE